MGKLAVVIARESIFGKVVMATSSVGGRMQGVSPLTTEGLEKIRQVIFSLCPTYHKNESVFESTIWSKCKVAINHACLNHRINKYIVVDNHNHHHHQHYVIISHEK